MNWRLRAFLRGLGSVFDIGGTGYADGGEILPPQPRRPSVEEALDAIAQDADAIAGDVDRALGRARRDDSGPRS